VEGYAALVSSDFKAMVHSRFLDVLVRQRYWLSDSSLPAPPVATGLSLLATVTAADPVPVFVSSASDVLGREPVVPGSFGRVRVVKYQPERVELEADVPAGSDAVLASTERTAPSWRVAVDGSVRPLSTVDYFFRGVRLGPGLHRVVFTYEPRAFLPLLALSYAALLGAIAVGGVALWRTRSPSPSAAATRAVVE
jgi:hypothetical protein